MSLSIKTRSDDLDKLMQYAMKELGEGQLDALFINADSAPFNEIQPTTWEEAKRRQYLKDQGWRTYQFSEHGWLRGIALLNLTEETKFAQKLSKLSATLRGYVTPRPAQEQMVDIYTVSAESGLDRDFIYNVLSTRLLDTTYSFIAGAYFDPIDKNKNVVIIPIEYGLRPLPE